MRNVIAVGIAGWLMTSTAMAEGYILGMQQQSFTCPAANCKTQCVGPGGPQTITGYKQLDAFMISQADRLWLQMDKTKMIVLGVGDRCTFDGTAWEIKQRPGGSSLLPGFAPAVICIGSQCN